MGKEPAVEQLQLPPQAARRYVNLRFLGRGGMGEVWKANDAKLGRTVALKVISARVATNKTIRQRFRREVMAMAKLNHKNVVRLFDFVEEAGQAFFTMEFIEGKSLEELCYPEPLEVHRTVNLISQVADGLVAAHKLGILHRDIKAQNILVTPENNAVLMDFGLAMQTDMEEMGRLTGTGRVVGTFLYLPPEILRHETWDVRCEVYQLGMVLYFALTGRLPMTAQNLMAVARNMPVVPPQLPSTLNDECDDALDALVLDAIAADPHVRVQNVADFHKRCRQWLDTPAPQRTTAAMPALSGRTRLNKTAGRGRAKMVSGASRSVSTSLSDDDDTGDIIKSQLSLFLIGIGFGVLASLFFAFIFPGCLIDEQPPQVASATPCKAAGARTGKTPDSTTCKAPGTTKPERPAGDSRMVLTPKELEEELLTSTERGISDRVSACIERGADVNCLTKNGWRPIHIAAHGGFVRVAVPLAGAGADLDARTSGDGATALSLAVRASHSKMVAFLLAAGANPELVDGQGYTPLLRAIKQHDIDMAATLIIGGASVIKNGKKMGGPVEMARRTKSRDMLRLLVLAGAVQLAEIKAGGGSAMNINRTMEMLSGANAQRLESFDYKASGIAAGDLHYVLYLSGLGALAGAPRRGWKSIHRAVWLGDEALIHVLIEKDPSIVKQKDSLGRNPLHIAAIRGAPGIINILLKNGAFIDYRDNFGFTPLLLALKYRRNDAAKALISARASVDIPSRAGVTCLHIAAASHDTEQVRLLIKSHAPLDAADELGYCPLHWAGVTGAVDVVRTLLSGGANPNSGNGVPSPLSVVLLPHKLLKGHARSLGKRLWPECPGPAIDVQLPTVSARVYTETAMIMIGHRGTNLLARDAKNRTPLHIAVQTANSEVVDALCGREAGLGCRDINGNTPLHYACMTSVPVSIMESLVSYGASVNTENKRGKTAKDLARSSGRLRELMRFVRER